MFGRAGDCDTTRFEVTPLLSGQMDKSIEPCGALDASFEWIKAAPTGVGDTFTRLHVVPGSEYGLCHAVGLVGEIGIGLNDQPFTCAGVGIALCLR
jgi:hypothetical protein